MFERVKRMTEWAQRIGKTTEPVAVPYEGLGVEQRLQLERWRKLLHIEPSIKALQVTHTASTIDFMVNTIRSYPQLFRTTGKTPFIHPLLAGTNNCEKSGNIFNACFMRPDQQLHHHVYALISCRPQDGSLDGLLTSVQALLLGLMALLFCNQRMPDTEARRLLHALAAWTQILYDRLPQQLPSNLSPWGAWVFAESVRRTILMSHLLITTYSLATTGTCLITTFYTALPLDARTELWGLVLDPEDGSAEQAEIVSYKEYTEAYKDGKRALPLDCGSFETLLTVACAGFEAVREKGDVRVACASAVEDDIT